MVGKRVKRLPKLKAGSPKTARFVLDCSHAYRDNIIDPAGLEKYFSDSIKVDGKTGNFEKMDKKTGKMEKMVTISRDKARLTIEAALPFKKRYVKYLTKKYLAKHQIRDFLRVIATGKEKYELHYFAAAKSNEKA